MLNITIILPKLFITHGPTKCKGESEQDKKRNKILEDGGTEEARERGLCTKKRGKGREILEKEQRWVKIFIFSVGSI